MNPDQDTSRDEDGPIGPPIRSFVIKIWREVPEKGKQPRWRGHITHVPGQERRYLKSLDDAVDFINTYLGRMGVRVGLGWRWKQWWKRRAPM